ncbi:hypothetical protein T08_13912 [Trichinella sp. T8]|nr:hypothetical protein T08_13912 [Trichinella sp. T8]
MPGALRRSRKANVFLKIAEGVAQGLRRSRKANVFLKIAEGMAQGRNFFQKLPEAMPGA